MMMGTLLETIDNLNPKSTNVPIAQTIARPADSNGNITPLMDRKLRNRIRAIKRKDMGINLIISVDMMSAT